MTSNDRSDLAAPLAAVVAPTTVPPGDRSDERLAHLFRRCTQAGRIHPLQHLIQLHHQGRTT